MAKPVGDERLRLEIERALTDDFLLDESELGVEVSDGMVTLVGTVGTYAEKVVAQTTTRSVEGVHDLVNAVTVKPTEVMKPKDPQLVEIVENVLAWDALVPDGDIEVSVCNGVVTLSGRCPTTVQAQEAERAVSHIGGVQDLIIEIEVTEPDLRTADVRAVITQALTRRAMHQAAQIDIILDGAHVTLAGPTQSPMEKRAIMGAVSHANGITGVRDELAVDDEARR
ncbi:MAG: BON domain-containing protein [Acidimicrobiales bacterium]